jgi:TPR repeat protein
MGCAVFLVSAHAGDLEDGIKVHERGAYAKAAAAFELAGAEGSAAAQRRLGFMYYHGEGVRQDNVRAVALLERAANAGDAESARDLGAMYEFGMSVVPDLARSAAWFGRAAELGDPHSQFRLSIMYYQGEGVARDRVEAAKWWTVAMRNSPDWDRRLRPQIASAEARLSAEENAEGRRKAAEWLKAREANR